MSRYSVIVFLALLCLCHMSVAMEKKKTYIIHMAKSQMPAIFDDHTQWYASALESVSDSAEMIYTYNNVVHGFSASLTAQQAESLENQPGVLSVFQDSLYQLHTTRTPFFLGLEGNASNFFPESEATSNLIVGVLDTGVWPEVRSFNDGGLRPVPDSWKGECESGTNFSSTSCNKKLVGARYYSKGYESGGSIDESEQPKSPRDIQGHGTHTASTIAGSAVPGANLFGYANGTARGMATRARVAVYKVCWLYGCTGADILAGMDKAIDDNVNVLSLSLGGEVEDYYQDIMAIGAFAAMEKGILVSCSAGNSGPGPSSLTNIAPWITTVGAGTLDRDFPAPVKLGNGEKFYGVSLYGGDPLPKEMLPFVYAGNASNDTSGKFCLNGTLIPEKVKGKIVLCDIGGIAEEIKGLVVQEAGGVGMVVADTRNGTDLIAAPHFIPATDVGKKAGDAIKNYLNSDSNPTATILFEGTKVGIEPSPVVAAFSSRGPNPITPEILKPDIIAPGISVLAGWSGAVSPSSLPEDPRRVEFNIISGTSMSCPHVSGLAALLKGAHPEWSPAAIRSALMTTAYTAYKNGGALLDTSTEKPSTPFAHGAGHVDPVSALDPGLIYDINADDYLDFLCAVKYTPSQINIVARRNFTCDESKKYSVTDLNYPSFAVVFPTESASSIKYSRTLTNVGPAGTYKVTVSSPSGSVKINVEPETLTFTTKNEKKSYTVTFTAPSNSSTTDLFGKIEWSDGKHVVTSPVAISWT